MRRGRRMEEISLLRKKRVKNFVGLYDVRVTLMAWIIDIHVYTSLKSTKFCYFLIGVSLTTARLTTVTLTSAILGYVCHRHK